MAQNQGGGNARQIPSIEDLQGVQALVERCLQLYLSKSEVLSMLDHHANVDPAITDCVWRHLVMQNPEFFESYAVRLRVKQQIGVFNELVRRQHDITGAAVPPLDRIYPMTKMSTRPDASAFNELSAILDGTSSGPVWPGPTELPPSGSVGHIPPIERLWQSYLAPISELQPPSPNPSSHTQARQGSLDGSPQPRREMPFGYYAASSPRPGEPAGPSQAFPVYQGAPQQHRGSYSAVDTDVTMANAY